MRMYVFSLLPLSRPEPIHMHLHGNGVSDLLSKGCKLKYVCVYTRYSILIENTKWILRLYTSCILQPAKALTWICVGQY